MFDVVTCAQLKLLLADGAQLIDVRSRHEFDGGALPGAVNIPLNALRNHTDSMKKDKPVLLYCRSGQRSAFAKQELQIQGFVAVYNIGGYYQYTNC